MKQILVQFGERKVLGKMFGVSRPTVRAALNGQTRSDISAKIRRAALNRGGVEVNEERQHAIKSI